MEEKKNSNLTDDFSFVKLRNEIFNKTGVTPTVGTISRDLNKKLKFEPNINVTRQPSNFIYNIFVLAAQENNSTLIKPIEQGNLTNLSTKII
jgi:hypothetical protein